MKIIVKDNINERLEFEHNPETRTITGKDSDIIEVMIMTWEGIGIIYGTQTVDAPDPLGSYHDMGVMLASLGYWGLPEEIYSLFPPVEDIPEGAIA